MKERIRCALVASLLLLPSVATAQEPAAPTKSAAPPRTEPARSNGAAPNRKPDEGKAGAPSKPAEGAKPGEPTNSGEPAKLGESPSVKPGDGKTPLSRDARIRELETKVERLTRAITDMKAAPPPAAAAPENKPVEPAPPVPAPQPSAELDPLRGVVINGYLQAQLENHEDSEDQVRPGGAPYNQNRFLIRRGRIRIEREWDWSALMMELDGNTTKGPAIQLFKAEASVMWRGGQPKPAPPLIKLTMGLFDVPFGYEVLESPRYRHFMERSLASRAFFPTEPDLGIRLSGELGWFRYAFAVTNGQPLGTADGFGLQDPNNHKDFLAKISAFVQPTPESEVWGGVSMLNGLGFVKAPSATKNILVWTDRNEDRIATNDEILGQPGTAASVSYNFDRWAVAADIGARLKTKIGYTKVYGELQLGSNMDRALFVANPTISGQPSRELGWYFGVLQEITPYEFVGFRMDLYNPNADFLGYRSGKQVPRSQTVRTYSPLVGMAIPGRAKLIFQYDFVSDSMGLTPVGLPTDLANDQWTLRLQGDL